MRTRLVGLLLLLAAHESARSAVFLGPLPYTSRTNSPFFPSIVAGTTLLEDFEDGLLNMAGASASVGVVISPGSFTDSVDSDDGQIDGNGQSGRSFFINRGLSPVTFRFDAIALGGFPKHAGIVWTDGNQNATVTFEAFGSSSNSLGMVIATLGDASIRGTTPEDRFFGVIDAAGISAIRVTIAGGIPQEGGPGGGLELDHLQYSLGTFSATNTNAVALSIEPAVQLAWPSQLGVTYQPLWASEVDTNTWFTLGFPIMGNGTTNTVCDPTQGRSRRFYRVITSQ